MGLLANILSGAAEATTSSFTFFFIFDEPNCPEELL